MLIGLKYDWISDTIEFHVLMYKVARSRVDRWSGWPFFMEIDFLVEIVRKNWLLWKKFIILLELGWNFSDNIDDKLDLPLLF